MTEIYFSSTLMWNSSLEEIFKKAYLNGFTGIELWAQQFATQKFVAAHYQRLQEIYPIKTMIHSFSWDLNIASLNEAIREASLNQIYKSIDLANNLGALEVTVHPGKETICGLKNFHEALLQDSLKKILTYAQKTKIDVSLEIMEKIPKELITTDLALKRILGDVYHAFTYTVDIAHCMNECEALQYLKRIDRLSKIHISNKCGNKLHSVLNKGDYDFSELIFKLAEKKKPLVIEGYDDSQASFMLNTNINFIRSIKEDFLCRKEPSI